MRKASREREALSVPTEQGVKRTGERRPGSSHRFGRTEAAVALTTVTGKDREAGVREQGGAARGRCEIGSTGEPPLRDGELSSAGSGQTVQPVCERMGRSPESGQERAGEGARGRPGRRWGGKAEKKAVWLSGDIQQGPSRPA